ncbi:MAG: hypothetical protein WBX01_03515 [Nitrososphaeraceae archaeon]
MDKKIVRENYEKYIQSSNPVRAFFEAALEQNNNSAPSKSEVYASYKML